MLASAVTGLLRRAGLPGERVDDLIAGCVSQVGEQGANIGRLAAMLAGLPETVPGVSLNRMCGSSQQAVHFGAQAIAAGDMRYVIAGGVESMSRVPMFLDVTLGQGEFGASTRSIPHCCNAIRWCTRSRAPNASPSIGADARRDGRLGAPEPCPRLGGGGRRPARRAAASPAGVPARDEGIREHTDPARMAAMAPALRPPAGRRDRRQCQPAVRRRRRRAAGRHGRRAGRRAASLARFKARVAIGLDPVLQLTGVIPAAERALARAGLTLRDLDWIEINEAFACVVLAWLRATGANPERVNPGAAPSRTAIRWARPARA